MKAINIKTEYLKNPIGLGTVKPRILWNCDGGKKQTAYCINATVDGKECSSGKVESDSMHADFGVPLKSRSTVSFKIKLWDENAGAYVASVAENDRNHATEQECDDFMVFENTLFHKYTADADKTESERIVEQKLHRVNNVRVLKRLKHAVKSAYDETATSAEHTAVNHKRQKACKGDRAALGKFEQASVRERERESNRDCAVDDSARVVDFALVADKPHDHEKPRNDEIYFPRAI